MNFIEKLSNNLTTISFELFPPKKPEGWATLYGTLSDISKLSPDLVSVTYGAGGSTREKTIDLVTRLKDELEIEPMAHLTCVDHSRDELEVILNRLRDANINYVLALRGDPQNPSQGFEKNVDRFEHTSELIRFINWRYNFITGCATYPEKHIESRCIEDDIKYLRLKQDMGARFAITQLFFINENFYRFRELAVKEGVCIPIIAGIMPLLDINQIQKFRTLCGCIIPDNLIEKIQKSPQNIVEIGIDYAYNQCLDLIKNGVSGLHFFTLNRATSVVSIVNELNKIIK